MTISPTMVIRPATAVLFRRNRRMISCRRVSRLDSPAIGRGSSIGRSLAVSSSFSVMPSLLAQSYSGIEDSNQDVGQNRSAEHADSGKSSDGHGPMHVLSRDGADAEFAHSVEREDDLHESGAG